MQTHCIPPARPLANPENCICGKNYRITLLTEKLARFEYDETGRFEDRPTQVVWNRDFPPVPHTVVRGARGITIRTSRLCIVYDERRFSGDGLAVTLHGYESAHRGGWHYGDCVETLKGTARTLDEVDGDQVELEPGLIATDGYAVLDDGKSLLLSDDGWLCPRREGVEDVYLFGYGKDYLEALHDFYRLCGPAPMLPRFALGNWWSRYYPYTEESYLALMDRFQAEQTPFAVAVIDMDWHLVKVDEQFGSGWTGFTWNRALFPEPERFLSELHRRGMRVTLNLHPADGIRAYEEAYPVIAAHMGIDSETGDPVAFDASDPVFLEHYYEDVLHPLEKQGVDFWWVDWQQGTRSGIKGLDPLWVLNHYGFLDSGRAGARPLAFSRYSGPGSHRYPVGFSGDTIVTWESLQFQPYFTATASNIGYCWWSHDIGGHMRGCKDDELMARWTQFGVFSPILRLHSACSEFCGKEPWRYKPETADAMRQALRLRHRMLPYLYTMNHRCWEEGIPLVLPLYYLHPNRAEAYEFGNEYFFGSELLAAPVTTPRLHGLNAARTDVWLPDGLWYDIFEKRAYRGGRKLAVYRALDRLPVFARAGGILPMTDEIEDVSKNPEQLHVSVFLGAPGRFTLYEDDNETCLYETRQGALTGMELTEDAFYIRAARGSTQLIPEARRYVLEFFGCRDIAETVKVTADGTEMSVRASYDAAFRVLHLELGPVPTGKEVCVALGRDATRPGNDVRGELFAFLDQAEISFDCKDRVFALMQTQGDAAQILSELAAMELPEGLYGVLTELLTAY